MTEKPFSPACERNRDPILDVLRAHFADRRHVLEIGSGTGQHAAHFAAAMPWLTWQCSDRAENLPGIRQWLDDAGLSNAPPPIELDVATYASNVAGPAQRFLQSRIDAVFTANTLHIMSWLEVQAFFDTIGMIFGSDGVPAQDTLPNAAPMLVVYGPFNYGGAFTSNSNREFDLWLKARDPQSGIRDLDAVDALARRIGLRLIDDIAMPANNRCLLWQADSRQRRSVL